MKQKTKILTIIFICIRVLVTINFSKEFETYTCQKRQSALTVNLNFHNTLQFQGKVALSFWFKYKEDSVKTIFSINNLVSDLVVSLDEKNILKVGDTNTLLSAKFPSNSLTDFQIRNGSQGWNFIYFFFETPQTQSKIVKLVVSLNYEIFTVPQYILDVDLKEFAISLGSKKMNSVCDFDILFYQYYLYTLKSPFSKTAIETLSFGILEPVLLSKFNYETSYNKYYSNLMNSGIGDIVNGVDPHTFTMFSSLGTKNNKFNIKSHLYNNFSVFYLPDRLLPFYGVNNSYILVISYNFLFKNFKKSNFESNYNHVLYQRFPKEGIEKLIRADVDVKMSAAETSAINMRYFSNQQLHRKTNVNYENYLDPLKDDELYLIPFKFLIVKVEQNSLNRIPRIVFINGLDTSIIKMPEEFFELKTDDRHLIGDSESMNLPSEEIFSFIEIKEVFFLRGSFFQQNTSSNSKIFYYSGFAEGEENLILTCKGGQGSDNNNIKRNVDKSPLSKLDLLTCDNIEEINCPNNCDTCENESCLVCDPGYELVEDKCVVCEQGYDPILKVCFVGKELQEFFQSEFGNLKVAIMELKLSAEHYFLVTFKFNIQESLFLNNAFLFYINSRDKHNGMVDMCWDSNCKNEQKIYYSLMNKKDNFKIEKIIVGNSGILAINPISLILSIQTRNTFIPGTKKFKNFDCSFIGNYYFQHDPTSLYFGKCALACLDGFYKDYLTKRCIRCSSKCKTCISADICLSCNDNETLVVGECLPCQKPCLTCNQHPNKCTSCSKPQMLYEEKCNNLCRNKPEFCEVCDIYTGNCLQCKQNYSLSGGVCEKNQCSIENCKICYNSNSCRLCERGYTLSGGLCRVCTTNCNYCPFGYKLTVDFTCSKDLNIINTSGNKNKNNNNNNNSISKPDIFVVDSNKETVNKTNESNSTNNDGIIFIKGDTALFQDSLLISFFLFLAFGF